MKILLAFLMLFIGWNQILARSLPWYRQNFNLGGLWPDYDDDLYEMRSHPFEGAEFDKMMSSESPEQSTEASPNDLEDGLDYIFGNLLSTVVHMSEGSAHDSEIDPTEAGEADKKKQDNDNDNSSGEEIDNTDEHIFKFEINFNDMFGIKEQKSSEEKQNSNKADSKSSEEDLIAPLKDAESHENSSEVKPTLKLIDFETSSGTKKTDVNVDITEKDIEDLTLFFFTLNVLDDLINIENRNFEILNGSKQDDELKSKEVDQYLALFSSALEKVLQNELNSKEGKVDTSDQDNSDEINDDDKITNYSTTKKESTEENDTSEENTTIPEKAGAESNGEGDGESDANVNTNASDRSENELNFISFVFHGIDNDVQPTNLHDHEYSVVETLPQFKPTSSPFLPEPATASNAQDQRTINQYVEIREKLDTQQDTLKNNESALDKDFYSIIGGNYDDESINKFEKDIYVVHDNLDRIKRNINAMQNLQSKLYFHKLVSAAVKDAQRQSNK